jgi:hypothetical protein
MADLQSAIEAAYEPLIRRTYGMTFAEYREWTDQHLADCDQSEYGYEGCLHQPPLANPPQFSGIAARDGTVTFPLVSS